MNDFEKLTEELLRFRDERDWAQFHTAKDLALAISIESAELLELFLWKQSGDADGTRVREELADVLTFCLLMAEKYGLDVGHIVREKIALNAQKYPIEKSKGNARKYDEL